MNTTGFSGCPVRVAGIAHAGHGGHAPAPSAEDTVVLKVRAFVPPDCGGGIEDRVLDVPGVRSASLNHVTGELSVVLSPGVSSAMMERDSGGASSRSSSSPRRAVVGRVSPARPPGLNLVLVVLASAIGPGTDVAMESADIVLVRNDPRDDVGLLRLSRLTSGKMRQSLVRATGYNAVALPLAAGVGVPAGIVLRPEWGALFMAASSIIVVTNALLTERRALGWPSEPRGLPLADGRRGHGAVRTSRPGGPMVQKVIGVVGTSRSSFAKAAEDAVAVAGKTVRGMKWARVSEFELELDGPKIRAYRATVRIYFDVERRRA